MKKLNTTDFLERVIEVHGSYYDYSKTEYKNKRTKVNVTCPIHGDFQIHPNRHWLGQGCRECGYLNRDNGRSNLNEFIEKVKIIHNDFYDYSSSEYITAKEKIKIICPIHGEFTIRPNNHLNGQGCRECGNDLNPFKKDEWVNRGKDRDGIFYIIKCYDKNEVFYKFGITFKSIKERYAKSRIPYQYEVLREIKSNNLNYIWDLEKRFKKYVIKRRYKPKIKFCGYSTECFI